LRTISRQALCLALLTLCAAGPADAQQAETPRGVIIEEVRNDQPAFMVRVDVDHPDRVYRHGDEMRVSVVSEKAGYLYLLYCDAEGKMYSLFPNHVDQDNRIPAGQPIHVPGPDPKFRLRIGPPFGQEVLKAIVSLAPLGQAQVKALTSRDDALKLQGVKSAYAGIKSQPAEWAEHYVTTFTMPTQGGALPGSPPAGASPGGPPGVAPPVSPPGGVPPAVSPGVAPPSGPPVGVPPGSAVPPAPAGPSRRVGVFIGISDFQDPAIRDLKVGEKDALAMAEAMKRLGRLDEAWTLVGPQASLRNIEEALRKRLPAATRPGDVVVIYWSGHGARCADVGGDERDGFDEYLVPYDGRFADDATIRQTMLLDDTFGRWLQGLDGRKLLVVLDTCHSGGQTTLEKSLAKGLGNPQPAGGDVQFDFLDGEMERAKDIGQKETALLASSLASQVSFERKEGDLSTMTYFLVQEMSAAPGPLTLAAAYENLKRQVAAYVERNFLGTTQTPVLVDNLSPPFYLRP
jgi:hypothetical protein